MTPQKDYRSGLEYLRAATELLQRIRSLHPTAGLYEAADLQWWWRTPRATDRVSQLFWFDDDGLPIAATTLTDWGDEVSLDPHVLPDAGPEWVAEVIGGGLAHAAEHGFERVSLEVDDEDIATIELLISRGFARSDTGLVESWLDVANLPAVSPLAEGFELLPRTRTLDRPHHMISRKRNHDDVEVRLNETSLYRADLDLAVYADDGTSAAYGLFWFDPASATGLVEPMRTEDEYQGRGLAKHVLTAGVHLLADAGAQRIKIGFEPDNEPARRAYLGAGFEPHRRTTIYAGPTSERSNPQRLR